MVAHIATSPAFSFDIEPWPLVIGIPLRPIQAARQTSSRAASISVATSASVCWSRCWSSRGAPPRPCRRGNRASTRRPPGRFPGADAPTMAQLERGERVRRASGGLARAGTLELALELLVAAEQVIQARGSPRGSPEVCDARMPSLTPSPIESPGVPFGTTNEAWPRWPRSLSTVATTTVTSAIPLFVMKTLVPFRTPLVPIEHRGRAQRSYVRACARPGHGVRAELDLVAVAEAPGNPAPGSARACPSWRCRPRPASRRRSPGRSRRSPSGALGVDAAQDPVRIGADPGDLVHAVETPGARGLDHLPGHAFVPVVLRATGRMTTRAKRRTVPDTWSCSSLSLKSTSTLWPVD